MGEQKGRFCPAESCVSTDNSDDSSDLLNQAESEQDPMQLVSSVPQGKGSLVTQFSHSPQIDLISTTTTRCRRPRDSKLEQTLTILYERILGGRNLISLVFVTFSSRISPSTHSPLSPAAAVDASSRQEVNWSVSRGLGGAATRSFVRKPSPKNPSTFGFFAHLASAEDTDALERRRWEVQKV